MPYNNLLNNTCRIQRSDSDNSSENEYNEEIDEMPVVEDDVQCRLEKLYDRELVEAYAGGDHDKGIYCLYLKKNTNVRASDLITVYETAKIIGFSVTTVNGIYKRSETLQINNMPVYVHTSTDYRLIYKNDVWVLQDIATETDLYKSSTSSLKNNTWVVVDGTGTTGKSRELTIADFHYNTYNKPTQLIVNDVEDAGGGQRHHIQCFCRYRKEIN